MNIPAAIDRIESALIRMETALGETAFDEWALVSKTPTNPDGSIQGGWKLVEYGGSRKEGFLADFNADMAALKNTLDLSNTYVGDSAFSHEGHGSGFDAHMCIGENLFLLLNNTTKSTGEITSNPKWTSAQIYFAELLEAFIADPIA